jgi:hypothetical protein
MCQRQLSNDELTVLMSWHCGIAPAQYQAITEIDFVVDPDDPGEIHVIEWTQTQRQHFLILAARYGRPN